MDRDADLLRLADEFNQHHGTQFTIALLQDALQPLQGAADELHRIPFLEQVFAP